MTAEEDVQQLEELVKRIEDSLKQAASDPARREETLALIGQAETIFDGIISGYIDNPEKPSFPQTYLVSDLQERLHQATDNLPPPAVDQKPSGGGTDKGVTIYTTPGCPWCRKMKNYLAGKGIAYLEYNVAQDRGKAQEMIEKSGQMGVPVIVVGSQVIIGFDQDKLAKLLS